jgi:nicotinate-nucleotide pyrophosphorylase (carboxylating)
MLADLNSLTLPQLFETLTADGSLQRMLEAAFREDAQAPGDITSQAIIPPDSRAKAALKARQAGVIAGLAAIPEILAERALSCASNAADGERCEAGQILATLEGSRRDMLLIERVLLNVIGRMSGVATLTRAFVDSVKGARAVICDTRKTMPGMRGLDKYAVRCGGGTLHRMGLFDAALFKDNHLAAIPHDELGRRIEHAARAVRAAHDVRFVEVEVDGLEQLGAILAIEPGLIDVVLLDNMSVDQLRQAVGLRNRTSPRVLLEASGGVALATVRAIAETGVDRISVGAITHSAKWLDIGLDISDSHDQPDTN